MAFSVARLSSPLEMSYIMRKRESKQQYNNNLLQIQASRTLSQSKRATKFKFFSIVPSRFSRDKRLDKTICQEPKSNKNFLQDLSQVGFFKNLQYIQAGKTVTMIT